MSIADNLNNIYQAIKDSWDAVVQKGGARISPANLSNMITALNSIGTSTSVTPSTVTGTDALSELETMSTHLSQLYDMVEAKSGIVPAQKNFENLAAAILSIPVGMLTIPELQEALNNGTAPKQYPAGTLVKDEYNGQVDNLVIVQYLDPTNNQDYGGAIGVMLSRNFPMHPDIVYDYDPSFNSYKEQYFGKNCNMYDYLNSRERTGKSYLDGVSDELAGAISEITIPVYNTTSKTVISLEGSKWFLLSTAELYGTDALSPYEGIATAYWKERTGLDAPSNDGNEGRIARDATGKSQAIWTRTHTSLALVYVNAVNYGGGITNEVAMVGYGQFRYIYPTCFIPRTNLKDLGTLHYMDNGVLKEYPITTQEELNKFARRSYDDTPIELNYITVAPDDVIGYDFGKDVKTIPQTFMSYLRNYNWPITLDFVMDVDYAPSVFWFSHLDNFNSKITITDSFRYNAQSDHVRSLGSMFVHNPKFNQPFTLPAGIEDVSTLLDDNTAFNQPIVFPPTVTTIGGFKNCPNMVGPITYNGTQQMQNVNFCLLYLSAVPDAATCKAFTQGVSFIGTGAEKMLDHYGGIYNYNAWKTNSGSDIWYRNIIGGTWARDN